MTKPSLASFRQCELGTDFALASSAECDRAGRTSAIRPIGALERYDDRRRTINAINAIEAMSGTTMAAVHRFQLASFGPFRLSAAERQLKNGDEPLPLGGRALDTLIALVEQAGEVVTQRELISRVWPDVTVEEANLRVHI